jgi:hypothetical protein
MFNQIRWRLNADCPRVHSSEPYATSDAAIADTGPLFMLNPYEIWVECADGTRIEANEIVRKCRGWSQLGQAANA